MSGDAFQGRHVLVVGQRLAPVAQEAMGHARFEIAAADRLDVLAHAPIELVVIDAEQVDPTALVDALAGLAASPKPPAVMLSGAHLPAGLVRALMKLPRTDVIEPPFTSVALGRACATLLDGPGAIVAAPPVNAKCWTVIGSVGGCGATTIAVELATALSLRAGAGQRVALVDLNLVDGAAAAYLGAQPAMLLADASHERIDPALLAAFAVRISDKLDLLAAPRDPKAFAQVSQTAICRMLEVAAQVYDWIVVDTPRHHQSWTLDVLSGSDEVLVVSELTVPALLAARALAAEIEAEMPDGPEPRIILNRLASRVFGPAPSLAEAEKALQRKADGGITSDWEAAAASVNLGGSISHHRPRSRIVRDIAVLVDKLTTQVAVDGAQKRRA
jgi:pilus assembly protein CpaE